VSDAKPVESRQRRNMPSTLSGAAGPAMPDPPADLSNVLRRQWQGLWSSPIAALMDPVSDLPGVTRLFELYTLADRVQAKLSSDDSVVDGALVTARVRLASEIRLAEGQLGLSPRSRLALGIALLAGQKAASLDDAVDDADDD
jgi:hypothetical protein